MSNVINVNFSPSSKKFRALKKVLGKGFDEISEKLKLNPEIPIGLGLGAAGTGLGMQSVEGDKVKKGEVDKYAAGLGLLGSGIGLLQGNQMARGAARSARVPLSAMSGKVRSRIDLLMGLSGAGAGGTLGYVLGNMFEED